jgi:hypothetical protein
MATQAPPPGPLPIKDGGGELASDGDRVDQRDQPTTLSPLSSFAGEGVGVGPLPAAGEFRYPVRVPDLAAIE